MKRAAAGLGTRLGQGGGRGKAPRETSSPGLQSRPATMSQMQLQMQGGRCERKTGARSHLQMLWKKVSQGFL